MGVLHLVLVASASCSTRPLRMRNDVSDRQEAILRFFLLCSLLFAPWLPIFEHMLPFLDLDSVHSIGATAPQARAYG